MITRKIGKILRGKATPLQIMLACVLGSMLGFVPGFAAGPGAVVGLVLLLIILNANLGVALFSCAIAKLISLPLMPVSFAAGRVLLDGPTSGIFKAMINAPVLALIGFDHYATTGGLTIGLVVGFVLGLLVVKLLRGFRSTMSKLEEGSPRFQKIAGAWWARTATWIFIGGGRGKKTYADLLSKKIGNPIRPLGVVVAVLVLVLGFLLQQFASEPIVTAALRNGLERANGATVDVEQADLDLAEGRLVVDGLALADPNALETDLFRAVKLEADVSGADLLRKRIRLDRLVISEASSGEARDRPGRLVGPAPEPADQDVEIRPGEKTIEDYMAQAEVWKERLAQVRRWIEKVRGGEGEPAEGAEGEAETLGERLAREAREKGYARVVASHLIDDVPRFAVTELIAEGVRTEQLEGEVLDIRGHNISTEPHLETGPTSLAIESRSGRLRAEITFRGGESQTENTLAFRYNGLQIDRVTGGLAVAGTRPLAGGTMDVDLDGGWSARGVGYLDLPLRVTLHDTRVSVPGGGSADVGTMVLPIGIRGPIDDPRITLDANQLADALVQAGAGELAGQVRSEAEKAIGDLTKKAQEEAGEAVGEAVQEGLGNALEGLIPGGKKDDP